jgi:hypothetical protein
LKFALMEVLNVADSEEGDGVSVGGIDQSLSDADGRTALHLCSALGHLECVRFLIENGAAVDVPDAEGKLPLELADVRDAAIAQLLIHPAVVLLLPGTAVEVGGLTSATVLNGQRGVVIAAGAQPRPTSSVGGIAAGTQATVGGSVGAGRVQVLLAGNEAPKAIRVEHLTRVADLPIAAVTT